MSDFSEVVKELRLISGVSINQSDRQYEIVAELKNLNGTLTSYFIEERDRNADAQFDANAAGGTPEPKDDSKKKNDRNQRDLGFIGNALSGLGGVAAILSASALGIGLALARMNDDFTTISTDLNEFVSGTVGALVALDLIGYVRKLKIGLQVITFLPRQILNLIMLPMKGIGKNIMKGLRPITNIFRNIGTAVKPFTDAIGGFFSMLGKGTRAIGGGFGTVGRMIMRMLPILSVAGDIAKVVMRSVARFSGVFTIVLAVFDGVMAALSFASANEGASMVDIIRAGLIGAWEGFTSLIGDLGTFFGWVTERFLRWMGVSEEVAAGVREGIENFANAFEGALNWLFTTFLDMQIRIGDWIASGVSAIANFLRTDHFAVIWQSMLVGIETFKNMALNWARDLVPNMLDSMPGWVRNLFDGMIPEGPTEPRTFAGTQRGSTGVPNFITGQPTGVPTARASEGVDRNIQTQMTMNSTSVNNMSASNTNITTNNSARSYVSLGTGVNDQFDPHHRR